MEYVKKKLEEAEKFVMQYKDEIPIKDMAKFLGWQESTVRNAIERGNFPGIYFQPTLNGRKVYKILPLKFLIWYTDGGLRT